MPRPKNSLPPPPPHPQLFHQLARQSLRSRFPSLQFPARKFPHQFKSIPPLPLANQDLPVRLNQPSHHSQHAVSRIARANARAPSTNGGPGGFKSSSRITTTRRVRTP